MNNIHIFCWSKYMCLSLVIIDDHIFAETAEECDAGPAGNLCCNHLCKKLGTAGSNYCSEGEKLITR